MSTTHCPHRVGALVLVTGLLVGFAAAAVPVSAATAHPSYTPTRSEKCRAGYTRQVRHVRRRKHGKTVTIRHVSCVYSSGPVPTSVGLGVVGYAVLPGNPFALPKYFQALVLVTRRSETGQGFRDLPVTLTIFDRTANQPVASFTKLSGPGECAVQFKVEADQLAFFGAVEEIGGRHLEACSLAPVTMPAAHVPVVSASFAGSSSLAPSRSGQEAICRRANGPSSVSAQASTCG